MNIRKKLIKSVLAVTLVACFIVFIRSIGIAAGEVVQDAASTSSGSSRAILAFAAMGSVGLSCITSAYALARIGTAAMGAMSEKPEIGGRALIFLGMAEGIAIYGLIIGIMLINKI